MEKEYTDIETLIKDLLDFKCVINVRSESEDKEFIHIMRDKYNMGWYDRIYASGFDWFKERTCYDFELGKNDMMNYEIDIYEHTSILVIPYSQIRDLLVNGSIE